MRSVAIRAHPLVFGTVVFLASESMVFAALLAAYYYLRGMTATWPPAGAELDPVSMGIGTALLAAGSVTMTIAQSAATRGGLEVACLGRGDAQAMVELLDIVATRFQRSEREASNYRLALLELGERLVARRECA